MEVQRIALLDREGLADPVVGVAKGNLLAASRSDEHPGTHDIEAIGLEARDQRPEVGQDAFEGFDANRLEVGPQDFRCFARELAVG